MREKSSQNHIEPTKSELEILQVLWEFGPSTVRFVNDHLNEQKREVQYTSTLKLMQIMVEKGLLKRDESQMKHVYMVAVEEDKTKSFLLERFVEATEWARRWSIGSFHIHEASQTPTRRTISSS